MLSKAHPYFVVPFIPILASYLKLNDLASPEKPNHAAPRVDFNVEETIALNTINIMKNCVPFCDDLDISILNSIESDLTHIINSGTQRLLSFSIESLCTIVTKKSMNISKILKVFLLCIEYGRKVKSTIEKQEQIPQRALPMATRSILVTSNIVSHIDFDALHMDSSSSAELSKACPVCAYETRSFIGISDQPCV